MRSTAGGVECVEGCKEETKTSTRKSVNAMAKQYNAMQMEVAYPSGREQAENTVG